MKATVTQWFDVSRDGLKALVADRPKSFIVRELVQNAWDEPDVTEVSITLRRILEGKQRGKVWLRVSDDAPEGFYDLRHAFTLFSNTRKRTDPEKRGRFNIGEKQILALCEDASIVTTTGSVIFDKDGRRSSREKTDKGSIFSATIKMNKEEFMEVRETVKTFLPSSHINTYFNGVELVCRIGTTFEASLQTEYADKNGDMRLSTRKTTVEVIEIEEDETPTLYEMGLPVCETGDKWHYNVNQRVPLTIDRDSVRPSYLRDLRAEVLNHMHEEITEDDSAEAWVQEGLQDERIESEAVEAVVVKQYGDKAFVPTPGDPRANERAISMGYTPVGGRAYSKLAWANIRQAEGVLPPSTEIAGKTEYTDFDLIPRDDWTDKMIRLERLTKFIAKECSQMDVVVKFIEADDASTCADFSGRTVRYNRSHLSDGFLDDQRECIKLIVHEICHRRGGHLEMSYHEELTRLAAELAEMEPKSLRKVWRA